MRLLQKVSKSIYNSQDYKSPSAFVVSNRILDKLQANKKTEIVKIVEKSPGGGVAVDGLTDSGHNHLLDFMVKIPFVLPFYWKTIKTNGEVQDAPRVAAEIEDVKAEIGDGNFLNFNITDNAPVMQAAWKILEEHNPQMTCNGCVCHVLNLLVKDLLKTRDNLMKQAEHIISFINNHHLVFAMFQALMEAENVTRRLITPIKTRWFSVFNSYGVLKESKNLLQRLVRENKNELIKITPLAKSKAVIASICNEQFWTQLDRLLDEIEYPANLIGKLESNDATSELVLAAFVDLRNHYIASGSDARNVRARQLVDARYNFIVNDHLRAAYMLNHHKVMSTMTFMPGEDIKCLNALGVEALRLKDEELKSEVIKELPRFHQRMTNLLPFERTALAGLSSAAYWRILGKNEFPALAFLAEKLLGPASAAISERAWSIYRWIHPRLRNRLTLSKIDKIAFLVINEEIHNVDYTFDSADFMTGEDNAE